MNQKRIVVILAMGAASVLAASCSSSSPSTVDASASGSPSTAPGTIIDRGTTSLPTSSGTAPDTSTTAPDTTTTVVGDPSASTTTAAGAIASTTRVTTAGPPTTAPPGGVVTTAATLTTLPPVVTTAPAVTIPALTLTASGPNGDNTVHCMGGITNTQASATWTTTGATQVAVALGDVPDAFAQSYYDAPPTRVANGSYPIPIDCAQAQVVTTVSAKGPNGTAARATITWTIHKG